MVQWRVIGGSAHWGAAVPKSSALRTWARTMAMDEIAAALGGCVCAVFYDCNKFYDRLNLIMLMETAEERGDRLQILAMAMLALLASLALWRISRDGCPSAPIDISMSIAASCDRAVEPSEFTCTRSWLISTGSPRRHQSGAM